MIKNLPANPGDTGQPLIQEDSTCCKQRLRSRALEPMLPNKRSHCHKKPMHCNYRKSPPSNENSAQPINNKVVQWGLSRENCKNQNLCPNQDPPLQTLHCKSHTNRKCARNSASRFPAPTILPFLLCLASLSLSLSLTHTHTHTHTHTPLLFAESSETTS